jgi:hypothetical protein
MWVMDRGQQRNKRKKSVPIYCSWWHKFHINIIQLINSAIVAQDTLFVGHWVWAVNI